MDQIGSKWLKIDLVGPIGIILFNIDQIGQNWINLVQFFLLILSEWFWTF